MQVMRWVGILAAIILVIACFFPWVTIESKNILVSGVEADGTNYGKPGYFHLFIIAFYLPFMLINKVWGRRVSVVLCALNLGWAIRNFFILTSCQGGECPVKHNAIYVVVVAAILMLVGCVLSGLDKRVVKDTE